MTSRKNIPLCIYYTLNVQLCRLIIDDLKQRDMMTEEFYATVKKEIAEYHYVWTASSRAAAKAGSMIPIRSVSLSSGGMIRKSSLPAGTWIGFLLP